MQIAGHRYAPGTNGWGLLTPQGRPLPPVLADLSCSLPPAPERGGRANLEGSGWDPREVRAARWGGGKARRERACHLRDAAF